MMMPYFGSFRVSSPYGGRTDPITGERDTWHSGIDLVGADSKVIRTPVSGRVIRSRMVTDRTNRTWEWGNYVAVAGEDGYTLYFCHLSRRLAEADEYVEAGQPIGIEGSTGRSTGSHLHFEVRDAAGCAVDAAAYLGIPNEAGFCGNCWDISPWAEEAVTWAMENGILRGNQDGDPMAKKVCTREEAAVMMKRLYDKLTGSGE